MHTQLMPSKRALALFTLLIAQTALIWPLIHNRLVIQGDIFLNISYAYDIKQQFELLDFFRFLKFFIFEAMDHKAQPLSHLMFPFLFFTSDPWSVYDGLALIFNLILIGSLFHALSYLTKSIFLPLVCAFCLANATISTEKLITFELVLVFTSMFWLAVARLCYLKNIHKMDPLLIVACIIAFMARPMESGIIFAILFLFFGKKYSLLKNKNFLIIVSLAICWWCPRIFVLWKHGQELPRFEPQMLEIGSCQIVFFVLAAANALLLQKNRKHYISDSFVLGLIIATMIIGTYFLLHMMLDDYSIFPILLLTACSALLISLPPLRVVNSLALSLLAVLISLNLISDKPLIALQVGLPPMWNRPKNFQAGPLLASHLKQKNTSRLTFIYSERLLQSLKPQMGVIFNKTQLIHLYLLTSLKSQGVYTELSWPYKPHILWWKTQQEINPPLSSYDCENLRDDESAEYIIVDTPDHNQLNTTGRFFSAEREITNISQFPAQYISTDTITEGVSWNTFYGQIDCP